MRINWDLTLYILIFCAIGIFAVTRTLSTDDQLCSPYWQAGITTLHCK